MVKKILATNMAVRAIALLMGIVLLFFALGKWNIIPEIQVVLFIEAIILIFGGIILSIETFKEGKFKPDFAGVLAIITILSTFALAGGKLFNFDLAGILSAGEAPIFTALTIFIFYELFVQGRK